MAPLRTPFKPVILAVALAFSASVQAIPLTTTVTGGNILLSGANLSVSDSTTSSSFVNTSQSASPVISQFNSSYGVLTSVTATITPGSSSTYLRADGSTPTGGTATVSTIWHGIDGLNVSGALNTASKHNGPNDGTSSSWLSPSQTITNSTALNSWVGSGSLNTQVDTSLIANRSHGGLPGETLTASISSSNVNNDPSYLTDLTTSYSLVYNYLQHAQASFAADSVVTELNLNFGHLYAGDPVASLSFNLFNLLGERAGLDLDLISGAGHTSVLTTNLTQFFGLEAGDNNDFLAFIDTSNPGTFNATYHLSLSDANIGASASRYLFDNYLTLNLSGTVIEAASAAAVPEPDMLALVGIGLLGFLGIRRTERKDEEANVASFDNTSLTPFGETEFERSTYQIDRRETSIAQRSDWDAQ
ncbi:PEP-CTERM sorting domain-containing protein [Nitrosomonas sp. Nm132]|uniref:PEP-CTERM sorting domain-containing protein n=1 Tax=Nitrosomonas sp. Nm132 TaxID=1881053 RepID=UPI00088ACE3C|nr:PEP-CTERM sorting domain-containing protein [Nitrosomonas sp. Nm132]SDG83849.1 PEP-CTERM protein-sorting domain-containing protein [Nitrosomonas sp. Nm132]